MSKNDPSHQELFHSICEQDNCNLVARIADLERVREIAEIAVVEAERDWNRYQAHTVPTAQSALGTLAQVVRDLENKGR